MRFATSDGFFKQLNSICLLYSDGGIPVCFLNEVEKPATVSNPTFFARFSMDKSESKVLMSFEPLVPEADENGEVAHYEFDNEISVFPRRSPPVFSPAP